MPSWDLTSAYGIARHGFGPRSSRTSTGWLGGRSYFVWMIPSEARVFPRAELAAAKLWVAGEVT
jgi:hypothetical protein